MTSSSANSTVEIPVLLTAANTALGRRTVSGRLQIEFATDENGRSYLKHQFASYPFHICRLQFHDPYLPNLATLYLQSCSGGLYEGDELAVAIKAGCGTAFHVSTQASTIVHSMPSGKASQTVNIEALSGSYVEYLPDPQILFPGSRSSSTVRIRISEGAVALISDACLPHDPLRAGEVFSTYMSEISIETPAGKVLAIDRLNLEGGLIERQFPGVTGAFSVQGTFVLATLGSLSPDLLSDIQSIQFNPKEAVLGMTLLPKSAGLLIRILAADGATLKQVMHSCWSFARLRIKGSLPSERRK